MKVFDCCIFYNEIDLLRLRLDYLEDTVDAFVVVEASKTHSGAEKPLFLSEPKAVDVLNHPKLRRVVIDPPAGLDAWGRENYQRNAIRLGLEALGANAEDLILVSDVDEIPRLDAIRAAKEMLLTDGPNTIAIFEQRLFYFRLNYELVWSRKLPWLGTVMSKVGDNVAINSLRTTGRRARGRKSIGFDPSKKVLRVSDGGWHFSYLGGDEELDAKLTAYSHQEHNTQAYRNLPVSARIESRCGLHERDGLHQVWAVIPPDEIGIDLNRIRALGLEKLIEDEFDSIRDVVSRITAQSSETRVRLGPLAIGLSGPDNKKTLFKSRKKSGKPPKLSVITAVHNQRSMNKIFWKYLAANTKHSFELIIIDNASTDGSAEFFESVGAQVIRNLDNRSYPASQNQGISMATGEWLAFLNNDVIVCEDWDQILLASAEYNSLDVITSCGIERVESKASTRKLRRRWNRIRTLLGLFGTGRKSLLLMHFLMYVDWQQFCRNRRENFKLEVVEGFVGNTVMLSRRGLAVLGQWDETQQAADFDLFLRSATRARDIGDIRPMHIALDCFNHHYIRRSMKGDHPPFVDQERLVSIDQKWTSSQRALLVED